MLRSITRTFSGRISRWKIIHGDVRDGLEKRCSHLTPDLADDCLILLDESATIIVQTLAPQPEGEVQALDLDHRSMDENMLYHSYTAVYSCLCVVMEGIHPARAKRLGNTISDLFNQTLGAGGAWQRLSQDCDGRSGRELLPRLASLFAGTAKQHGAEKESVIGPFMGRAEKLFAQAERNLRKAFQEQQSED
jgi:hypothetical protein